MLLPKARKFQHAVNNCKLCLSKQLSWNIRTICLNYKGELLLLSSNILCNYSMKSYSSLSVKLLTFHSTYTNTRINCHI